MKEAIFGSFLDVDLDQEISLTTLVCCLIITLNNIGFETIDSFVVFQFTCWGSLFPPSALCANVIFGPVWVRLVFFGLLKAWSKPAQILASLA